FTRQVPPSTILLDAQSMAGREMAFEHLSAPPAFETDDIIAVNGWPNRDGRCPLARCFGRGFTEADERLMHGRNQHRELIGRDLVAADICSNDVGRELPIRRWRFLCHPALSVEIDKIPCRAKSRCRKKDLHQVLRPSAYLLLVPL